MANAEQFIEKVLQGTRTRDRAATTLQLVSGIYRSLREEESWNASLRSFDVGESLLIPDGDLLSVVSFVHGYDAEHQRLVEFLFQYSPEEMLLRELCVKVAAHRDVRGFCYGDRGRAIGYPPLLGKILLILVPLVAEHGVKIVQCEPETEDLRRLYMIMGFSRGEVLELGDEHALRRLYTAAVHLGGTRVAGVR